MTSCRHGLPVHDRCCPVSGCHVKILVSLVSALLNNLIFCGVGSLSIFTLQIFPHFFFFLALGFFELFLTLRVTDCFVMLTVCRRILYSSFLSVCHCRVSCQCCVGAGGYWQFRVPTRARLTGYTTTVSWRWRSVNCVTCEVTVHGSMGCRSGGSKKENFWWNFLATKTLTRW